MNLEEKKTQLVETEWRLFQQVHNASGRAACQDDRRTFFIMRASQFASWPEALIDSYAADLARAEAAGHNLIAEKYAWMMENTDPQAFTALRGLLPVIPKEALALIEQIVAQQLRWRAAFCARYPHLGHAGRAQRSTEDTFVDTSFETYLRGELKTYSLPTLRLLRAFTEELDAAGGNLALLTMEATAKAYGYVSLAEAEAAQRSR